MVERGTKMLTQEQFMDYVNNHLKFHLMEYQKTALWEFYKAWIDSAYSSGRDNGKTLTYQIFRELLEIEQSSREP
jgi:hypothetical protein